MFDILNLFFVSILSTSPEVIKHFPCSSAEHKIYPAHKCLNANNCILTFISMINITPERLKAINLSVC